MGFRPDIFIEEDNKKVKGEKGFLPSKIEYSTLEYSQLKYNLTYAQDDEVFNNETIHIYARKYNGALFKFILCENYKDLEKFDYSNESLKTFAENRTLEHLKLNSFDLTNCITVIVLNDTINNIELVKRFCFLNSNESKTSYQMCFRIDNNQNIIYGYKKLRDYTKLFRLYNTAIKFDLGVNSFGGGND